MPVSLAIDLGLMFGPVADRLERRGISPALSARRRLILILLIVGEHPSFAVPLSEWVARAPLIWEKFRTELTNWKEPLERSAGCRTRSRGVLGGGARWR